MCRSKIKTAPPVSMIVLTGFLICGLSPASLYGQEHAPVPTLEVLETAAVSAPANTVHIAFAVEVNAPQAGDAVRLNAQQTDALLKSLRKMGDGEDELETSGYSLNPVYGRGSPQEPTAYRVRNMVMLTSKQIGQAGAYIDAAAEAGANRVDSVAFSHDQGEALRDQAAVKALQKALKTGEKLAQAAGMTIKRIQRIEYGSPGPVVRYARAALAEAGGAPTPIEAGELSVSATVRVVFEIQD